MKLLSCSFNMDTANVEMLFDDGSPLMIDCNAIENQFGTDHATAQRAGLANL